jgi:riboflavin synthase
LVAAGLTIGDSIAVNGVCLTVVDATPTGFAADVVKETLDRTNLGRLQPGSTVDLERPMLASGRFDGHIVQGHVDGVGRVERLANEGESVRMTIEAPETLLPYTVEKGSITVDGVSLTIAGLTADGFEVALIPHTLAVTVLGERRPGDLVNLEADVLAKYVERLLGERR